MFKHGTSRLLRNDFAKSLEEVGNLCNPLHHCELIFEGNSSQSQKILMSWSRFQMFFSIPSRRMRGTVQGQLLSRGSMRRWPILKEILEYDVACSRRRGGELVGEDWTVA